MDACFMFWGVLECVAAQAQIGVERSTRKRNPLSVGSQNGYTLVAMKEETTTLQCSHPECGTVQYEVANAQSRYGMVRLCRECMEDQCSLLGLSTLPRWHVWFKLMISTVFWSRIKKNYPFWYFAPKWRREARRAITIPTGRSKGGRDFTLLHSWKKNRNTHINCLSFYWFYILLFLLLITQSKLL